MNEFLSELGFGCCMNERGTGAGTPSLSQENIGRLKDQGAFKDNMVDPALGQTPQSNATQTRPAATNRRPTSTNQKKDPSKPSKPDKPVNTAPVHAASRIPMSPKAEPVSTMESISSIKRDRNVKLRYFFDATDFDGDKIMTEREFFEVISFFDHVRVNPNSQFQPPKWTRSDNFRLWNHTCEGEHHAPGVGWNCDEFTQNFDIFMDRYFEKCMGGSGSMDQIAKDDFVNKLITAAEKAKLANVKKDASDSPDDKALKRGRMNVLLSIFESMKRPMKDGVSGVALMNFAQILLKKEMLNADNFGTHEDFARVSADAQKVDRDRNSIVDSHEFMRYYSDCLKSSEGVFLKPDVVFDREVHDLQEAVRLVLAQPETPESAAKLKYGLGQNGLIKLQ